jgi:hypothetical protein
MVPDTYRQPEPRAPVSARDEWCRLDDGGRPRGFSFRSWLGRGSVDCVELGTICGRDGGSHVIGGRGGVVVVVDLRW